MIPDTQKYFLLGHPGNTPLHIAAGRKLKEIVALLMAYGANPAIPNGEGDFPSDLPASLLVKISNNCCLAPFAFCSLFHPDAKSENDKLKLNLNEDKKYLLFLFLLFELACVCFAHHTTHTTHSVVKKKPHIYCYTSQINGGQDITWGSYNGSGPVKEANVS